LEPWLLHSGENGFFRRGAPGYHIQRAMKVSDGPMIQAQDLALELHPGAKDKPSYLDQVERKAIFNMLAPPAEIGCRRRR
jgi:hypothetical protein